MALHPIFVEILAAFQQQPDKPICLDGATDGYGQHWQGVAQVTPDFTSLINGGK